MNQRRVRDKSQKIIFLCLAGAFVVALAIFFKSAGYISREIPEADRYAEAEQTTIGWLNNAPEERSKEAEELIEDNENIDIANTEINGMDAGVSVAQRVAKIAIPSVVGITVEKMETGRIFSNAPPQVGFGSGVIVSEDGYILTNHHVAGGRNNRITVSLHDGRNVDGRTVWADNVLDLAVVKINLTGLPVAKLGDATSLEVGEHAIAIGNPLGLEFQRSVTSGIISAVNRTIRIETQTGVNYMEDLIQTDASINPGNSGGPLLNARGEVVGINTVKVTAAEAMGFAIPINVAAPIVEKLVSTGTFTEAYIGLFAYDKSLLPYVDGVDPAYLDKGVYVAHIDEEGPAYKAGLRLGCIISEIDGKEINTMLQLRTILFSKNPGDTIMVRHLMHEEDRWVTVPVVLQEKTLDGNITR